MSYHYIDLPLGIIYYILAEMIKGMVHMQVVHKRSAFSNI